MISPHINQPDAQAEAEGGAAVRVERFVRGLVHRKVRLQTTLLFQLVSGFLSAPPRRSILSACATIIEFGIICLSRQDSFNASNASCSRPAPKKILHAMYAAAVERPKPASQ